MSADPHAVPTPAATPAPAQAPAHGGPAPAGARLRIVIGAALFSTGGTAIKASTFTALQVTGLRAAVAAIALLLLVPAARTIGSWRTWLVGIAYGVTAFLFVAGNKLTTAASTMFL